MVTNPDYKKHPNADLSKARADPNPNASAAASAGNVIKPIPALKNKVKVTLDTKTLATPAETSLSRELMDANRALGLPLDYPAEKTFAYLDHLNEYRSYDINGIVIDGLNWSKGNNAIMRTKNQGQPLLWNEEWLMGGKLHRIGGAAIVVYNSKGVLVLQEWYQDGNLHRDDGPASVHRTEEGILIHERWYQNGTLHRLDGPAITDNRITGAPRTEEWYKNGMLHRIGGAAKTKWNVDKIKTEQEWYVNGKLHRVNEPAIIVLHHDGRMFKQEWYQNGKLHRLDGPAVIAAWLPVGNWYIEGEEYTPAAFKREISRRKFKKYGNVALAAANFNRGDTEAPGTMQWAYAMGQFQRSHGVGLPRELKKDCMNAGYYVYGLVGDSQQPEEVLMEYTKDHLYYIASGMGLQVTKDMNKAQLCSLISGSS